MKLRVLVSCVAALGVILAGCTTGGPATTGGVTVQEPAPGQKITLKAVHSVNERTTYHTNFVKFKQAVEARTNGGITIEVFPNESLVKARDTLDAMSKGVADLGFISFAYYPGDLPFNSDAQILPFSVTWDTAPKVLAAGKPIFQKEVDKFNMNLLYPQPAVGHFMLKRPFPDAGNPNFGGQRINGVGPLAKVVELLGGSATSIPGSELPTAIRTGVIDGMWSSIQTYVNTDMVGDAPNLYDLGSGTMSMGIWWAINKDTWNRLPESWQKILLEEAAKAGNSYIDEVQATDRAEAERALAKGGKITKLTPDQLKVWRQKLQPYYEAIIQKHGEPMKAWLDTVDKIK
ncbi:MAG: TRAP transporter substrate-binding protein DctP [Dehalococcoidia bacterium]